MITAAAFVPLALALVVLFAAWGLAITAQRGFRQSLAHLNEARAIHSEARRRLDAARAMLDQSGQNLDDAQAILKMSTDIAEGGPR